MSNYFAEDWEPKLEFWLKTRCPSCGKSNFLATSYKTVKDVDGFHCYSCDLVHWLRPLWSVQEMYGHYIKGKDGSGEGYKDFYELLGHECDGILNVIMGQSRTMSLVK